MLTDRTLQAAAVVVLPKLAEMDPFGDDADPDSAVRFRKSDSCRDDGVIFNSAI